MFDANALKEHEEFTKVKNVEVIELGRYEMETWYFSPLPEEYRDCKVSLSSIEPTASEPSVAHVCLEMRKVDSPRSFEELAENEGTSVMFDIFEMLSTIASCEAMCSIHHPVTCI